MYTFSFSYPALFENKVHLCDPVSIHPYLSAVIFSASHREVTILNVEVFFYVKSIDTC